VGCTDIFKISSTIQKVIRYGKHHDRFPSRFATDRISYRSADSATGVTRKTAQRLAKHLGVDETQEIHRALFELATKVSPQYAADDGSLTAMQVRQIKKRAKTGAKKSVRSSLVDFRLRIKGLARTRH
jgi:hypothetical protein